MLQVIVKENDRYTIAEQMQMAIEGGCQWIQYSPGDATDEAIREIAREVAPLCKETSTILTIDDHVELAKELGIHGVLLIDAPMTPADAREFCGPEAIIGVQVKGAESVVPLQGKDVDYAVLTPDMSIEDVQRNIEAVRSAGIELPIVATGDYSIDQVPALKAAGVSGLALYAAVAESADPVAATSEILAKLQE